MQALGNAVIVFEGEVGSMRQFTLSDNGGDRATAYAMSSKIVSLPEGVLCTWIDRHRQNQWMLVDRGSGRVRSGGVLGEPCEDNHCGAALAVVADAVHAVTGAHHGPFRHYRLDPEKPENGWLPVAVIEAKGTYPSLVADSRGTLHLAFRAPGERWQLNYSRFADGLWSSCRTLVVADKPGYVYWTNGLAAGSDGTLHLVFGSPRVLSADALYYGASHLQSKDGGRTWETSCGRALSLPAPARDVPLIMGDADVSRVQSKGDQDCHGAPGPANYNYQQMLLSNPAVDAAGRVHVVIHNGLTGGAAIWSRTPGGWLSRSLTAAVLGDVPGRRIHMQSSLALGTGNRLHAVLMVAPTETCVWGPAGTFPMRVVADLEGSEMFVEPVGAPSGERANWLPALEHSGPRAPEQDPALLYTSGINAGGFSNNVNRMPAEVRLCLPG